MAVLLLPDRYLCIYVEIFIHRSQKALLGPVSLKAILIQRNTYSQQVQKITLGFLRYVGFAFCSFIFAFLDQSWSIAQSHIFLLIFISDCGLNYALLSSWHPLKTVRINKCILMEPFFTVIFSPKCICSMIQKASEVKCFLNALRYSNIMLYLMWKWQMDRGWEEWKFYLMKMLKNVLARKVKGL